MKVVKWYRVNASNPGESQSFEDLNLNIMKDIMYLIHVLKPQETIGFSIKQAFEFIVGIFEASLPADKS
jgi:hypothetical protein